MKAIITSGCLQDGRCYAVPGVPLTAAELVEQAGATQVNGVWRISLEQLQSIADDAREFYVGRIDFGLPAMASVSAPHPDGTTPCMSNPVVAFASSVARTFVTADGERELSTMEFQNFMAGLLLKRPVLLSLFYAATQKVDKGEKFYAHVASPFTRRSQGTLDRLLFTPLDVVVRPAAAGKRSAPQRMWIYEARGCAPAAALLCSAQARQGALYQTHVQAKCQRHVSAPGPSFPGPVFFGRSWSSLVRKASRTCTPSCVPSSSSDTPSASPPQNTPLATLCSPGRPARSSQLACR